MLAQGIAFPAVHSIISTTVPRERQSTAVAVVTAASYAGAAAASIASPWIISHLTWQAVFYIFGASAVLWLPFWFLTPIPITSSTASLNPPASTDWPAESGDDKEAQPPEQHANEDDQRLLTTPPSDPQPALPVPARGMFHAIGMDAGFVALMRRKEVWAIGVAQYCQSWGLYVLLNWLPTFYTEQVCYREMSKCQ